MSTTHRITKKTQTHQKKKQEPQHHHCDTCNKGFSRRRDLTRHMNTSRAHNTTSPGYECPICGTVLTRADIRKKHQGNQSCLDRFSEMLQGAIPIPGFTTTATTIASANANTTPDSYATPAISDAVSPATFDYDSPASFDYATPDTFGYATPNTFGYATPDTSSYATPKTFDSATPLIAAEPLTPVSELDDDDSLLFDTYTNLI